MVFVVVVFGVFSALCMATTKELTALFDKLKREMKSYLKEFKEWLDRDLRKKMREIKASLKFVCRQYGKVNEKVKTCISENETLNEVNLKLQTKCNELSQRRNVSRSLRSEQYSKNANLEIKKKKSRQRPMRN